MREVQGLNSKKQKHSHVSPVSFKAQKRSSNLIAHFARHKLLSHGGIMKVGFGAAYLALNELGLNGGPSLRLGSVTEQVHDDGTTGNGLVDIEQVLAGNPAILLSILPGLAALSDTDNDIQAVVAEVETLTVTLRAVADESQSVVLEVLLRGFGQHEPLLPQLSCGSEERA